MGAHEHYTLNQSFDGVHMYGLPFITLSLSPSVQPSIHLPFLHIWEERLAYVFVPFALWLPSSSLPPTARVRNSLSLSLVRYFKNVLPFYTWNHYAANGAVATNYGQIKCGWIYYNYSSKIVHILLSLGGMAQSAVCKPSSSQYWSANC